MNAAPPAPAPRHNTATRPWQTEIGERIRELVWLKIAGTTLWVWVFFIGYFHLLRYPARPVMQMPLTAIDHWVGFEPAWLIPYLTLWFYVGIAPGLQRGFRNLMIYGAWAGALCACGLLLFYLWPTQVPPLMREATDFPGYAMLSGIDAAGNACPSMHVAIALFTACWIERILRHAGTPMWLRVGNALWCLAIIYSTLATRQHVLLDALGGAVLGGVFAWASLRWGPAMAPAPALPPAGVAIIERR